MGGKENLHLEEKSQRQSLIAEGNFFLQRAETLRLNTRSSRSADRLNVTGPNTAISSLTQPSLLSAPFTRSRLCNLKRHPGFSSFTLLVCHDVAYH